MKKYNNLECETPNCKFSIQNNFKPKKQRDQKSKFEASRYW